MIDINEEFYSHVFLNWKLSSKIWFSLSESNNFHAPGVWGCAKLLCSCLPCGFMENSVYVTGDVLIVC